MRRRGFTLLELLIGMVITAVVLTALGAFTYAVSTNWQTAEAVESSYLAGATINARFGQYFRAAAKLGATHTGSLGATNTPAAIFFWKGDVSSNLYPNGDGKIEFNEIALIELDSASQEVRLYTVTDWDSWSPSAQSAANALASSSYIGNTANMSDFKTACGSFRVLLKNCSGMVVKAYSTDTPLVEYVTQVHRTDGSTGTYYGTLALRAAITPSN